MQSAAAQSAIQSTRDISESDFVAAVESAKLRALYNFAYGLSHEINNPLANIATRAQTLLADEKDADRRRKLATIVQQAFRAHEMIADLMLFAHPPRMQPRKTDLLQLVDTIIAELKKQANEQNTRLERVGATEPLKASIDPTAIAVAIKAIVQNGLEAVQTGGAVRIQLEKPVAESSTAPPGTQYSILSPKCSDSNSPPPDPPSLSHFWSGESQPTTIIHNAPLSPVPCPLSPSFGRSPPPAPRSAFLLTITDTGPGIPPDIRPHIFDPFFSGREAGRGLGLGLCKAWRIVDLHGGQIEVESEPSQGTTFRVILPSE